MSWWFDRVWLIWSLSLNRLVCITLGHKVIRLAHTVGGVLLLHWIVDPWLNMGVSLINYFFWLIDISGISSWSLRRHNFKRWFSSFITQLIETRFLVHIRSWFLSTFWFSHVRPGSHFSVPDVLSDDVVFGLRFSCSLTEWWHPAFVAGSRHWCSWALRLRVLSGEA